MKKDKQPGKQAGPEEEQFPGYPHYDEKEDIMGNAERVPIDEENPWKRNASAAAEHPRGQTGHIPDNNNDVSGDELRLLDNAGIDNNDAGDLRKAHLDETDEDGEPLNEASGREGYLGDDIDVPGAEADDAAESIGEEDEENNYYSLNDNDDTTDTD